MHGYSFLICCLPLDLDRLAASLCCLTAFSSSFTHSLRVLWRCLSPCFKWRVHYLVDMGIISWFSSEFLQLEMNSQSLYALLNYEERKETKIWRNILLFSHSLLLMRTCSQYMLPDISHHAIRSPLCTWITTPSYFRYCQHEICQKHFTPVQS